MKNNYALTRPVLSCLHLDDNHHPLNRTHSKNILSITLLAVCFVLPINFSRAESLSLHSTINTNIYNCSNSVSNTIFPDGSASLELQTADIVISGTVTSDKGEALPGATVAVQGTNKGTVTDVNGRYSLSVPEGATLVFSYIGYETQRIAIAERSEINISLKEDLSTLEEVVVIGYGTEERRNITGSVSSVKGKDIENLPAASVESLFQGRAPGVQVVQNSGTPGGGISVRIRGSSSINADNEPLYVLDGVPMNTGNYSKLTQDVGSAGANGLADINPNDIESIEFLKDAASAAVYGARAANGVVLITTKRGKAGQTSFNFSMYRGVQQRWRTIKQLNTREQAELMREASYSNGAAANEVISAGAGETDWLDEVFRTSPIANYDFSVRGGEKNIKYSLSMNYFDQEGILIATGFKRYSTRLNLDYQLTKRITLGSSLMLSRSDRDRSDAGNTNEGVLSNAIRKLPAIPVYDIFGNYVLNDPVGRLNPVAIANEVTFRTVNDRVFGNIFGMVEIMPGLSFKSLFGVDYISVKDNRFFPNTAIQNSNRRAYNGMNQNFTWLNENTINYNKSFDAIHNLSVLLGNSVQESREEGLDVATVGAPTNSITFATSILDGGGATGTAWGISSLFGRVSYDYVGKYLLSASFRRDGSSRFGTENRYGFFPSVSGGWRVSAEPFMQNLTFLNDLKIRGSVGAIGNQSIGDFTHRGLYSSGNNYMGSNGLFPTDIPNSNLKWETTVQSNAGVDITILNNRVTLMADVYYKKTNDLLVRVDIPSTTGFGSTLMNIGNVENKGVELSLTTENLTGAFKWRTSANVGFNENKILRLENDTLDITSSIGASLGAGNNIVGRARVGEPIGSFFGHRSHGVYASDETNTTGLRNNSATGYIFRGGDMIFADIDGNGVIDADDIVNIGRGFPVMQGGIVNDFAYKNFSLNIFLQYSYGNQVFNQTRAITDNMSAANRATRQVLRRWRQPGDVTDVPKAIAGADLAANSRPSSRWIEDGSYMRIKTVTLAYDFPRQLIDRLHLRNVRVYATAQNLFTFTRYTGFDPEVNFSQNPLLFGVDLGTYPQARTLMLGLNVGF